MREQTQRQIRAVVVVCSVCRLDQRATAALVACRFRSVDTSDAWVIMPQPAAAALRIERLDAVSADVFMA